MSNYGIIYVCRNRANGKMYVGQTTYSLQVRLSGHISRSRKGSNLAFHEAIKKYGRDGFEIRIVAACRSREEMHQAERFWIMKLDCIAPNGYNLTYGGEGSSPSEETRAKMRDSKKSRIITDEWRANLSLGQRGRKHSEETKAKMSANSRWRGHTAKQNSGLTRAEAAKKAITRERLDAMHAACRGKNKIRKEKGEKNANLARQWSEEKKARHSEILRRRFVGTENG